jgi:hypothetical protein
MGFSVRAESIASTPVVPAMDLRASWTAVTNSPDLLSCYSCLFLSFDFCFSVRCRSQKLLNSRIQVPRNAQSIFVSVNLKKARHAVIRDVRAVRAFIN